MKGEKVHTANMQKPSLVSKPGHKQQELYVKIQDIFKVHVPVNTNFFSTIFFRNCYFEFKNCILKNNVILLTTLVVLLEYKLLNGHSYEKNFFILSKLPKKHWIMVYVGQTPVSFFSPTDTSTPESAVNCISNEHSWTTITANVDCRSQHLEC